MGDEPRAADAPFRGIKVLDLTHALSGPFATQLLADQGADVVKVENPDHQDLSRSIPPYVGDQSHYFVAINHGKRSIALNLRSDEGRATLLRLAQTADILVENFRPGVAARMGLGRKQLAQSNPRLIQCSISGFGQEGEAAGRPAYDVVIQALSGFMSVTGEPGGAPLRCGVSIGDMVAGVYAVQAISTALYQREKSGVGSAIDVSMLDTLVSMLSYYVTLAQVSGRAPQATGSMHATLAPVGSFRTSDGWLVIAATTQNFWKNLCKALDRPDLEQDPRFHDIGNRQGNRGELVTIIDGILASRTTAEWSALLDRADVPNGPILDVLDLISSPIARDRRLFRPVNTASGPLQVSRYPVLTGDGGFPSLPADDVPALGQHSDEVLRDWLGESATIAGATGVSAAR